MERKERIVKNLKRITALLVFAAPCVLYIFLLRRRAGDVLLYTAPYQWWVVAIAFAAGAFSYIILRRERPSEEDTADEDYADEEISGGENNDSVKASDIPELDPDEYPELFREKETEEDASYDMSAGISAAISMQKAPTVTADEESEADRAWEEFSAGDEKEEFTYPEELYSNIPDLPEDYEVRESEDEEKEYSLNYTVRKPHLGETVLSKVLCVLAAVALSLSVAGAASQVCITESDAGFSNGKREYLFPEVESYTVSQKLLGSLSVEVTTADGEKTELFPATLFKGEKFSEKYDSIYAYMAHAVRVMRNSGAEEKIEDRDDIITSFRDAEDTSAKYIEEIIGEKLK